MQSLTDNIKSHDVINRMAHGAFWSITGTALGKFCILISGIICARLLGQKGFGELGMVKSTIGMFIVLGSAGIGVTATKFIAQYRESNINYASSIYRLSNQFAWAAAIIIALLILVFASPIAIYTLHTPELETSVKMGSILLLASVLNAAQQGVLAGLEDFRAIAINTLGASLAEALLMTLGAWMWGVEGALMGFGIGILILWYFNRCAVKRNFKTNGIVAEIKPLKQESKRILYNFCIPATLSALTVTPAYFTIRMLLVKDCGYNELAIFEAADQWKVIILFIPGAISNIVLPILSSKDRKQSFKRMLLANVALVGTVSAFIALVVTLLSPVIMPLYGGNFGNQQPLIILAISTVFSSIATVIEMAIYSKDKMWPCFWMNLLWALLLIIGCYLLLNIGYGVVAPAIAVLLSYLAKTIYMSIYILRIDETE